VFFPKGATLSLNIIVLAAERGTGIKPNVPQATHPLAGWPMVRYVVEAARALDPARLVILTGNDDDLVRQALGQTVASVHQTEAISGGQSLESVEQVVAGLAGTVLLVPGDVPLIQPETLKQLVECHQTQGAAVTLLTFQTQDRSLYDDLVRDAGTGQLLVALAERCQA
jgi:bifunctional UDP-N-acetylglucosamine pyrophosphorylase/glucosamine-1-phosphate N-acetyltransferase